MNEFNSIDQLQESWLTGDFVYPNELYINGVKYTQLLSIPEKLEEAITTSMFFKIYESVGNLNPITYEPLKPTFLTFVWTQEQGAFKPVTVDIISDFTPETEQIVEQQERIGDVVLVKLILPSGYGALKGRVDTGAEVSSLHAENIKISNGQVTFFNKHLSDNLITMPLATKQAVSSADGGTQYRAVVELDVEINGKPVRKSLFNLNDRSNMDYPCLIGINVLERTNFLIDPKSHPDEAGEPRINYESFKQYFADKYSGFQPLSEDQIPRRIINENDLKDVFNAMTKANFTLADLVQYIKTETLNSIDDIGY